MVSCYSKIWADALTTALRELGKNIELSNWLSQSVRAPENHMKGSNKKEKRAER